MKNFVFIVEELHWHLDKDDVELMTDVTINLWLRQNSMVHGRPINPSTTVVSKASESLTTF
jgi:hypothetical protein